MLSRSSSISVILLHVAHLRSPDFSVDLRLEYHHFCSEYTFPSCIPSVNTKKQRMGGWGNQYLLSPGKLFDRFSGHYPCIPRFYLAFLPPQGLKILFQELEGYLEETDNLR